ncbi:pseudaminic acid cytidylyltransferase [Ideonella margarita]|uniref:Pseudaminic acid cytidylyltransferase n=1 Tax=Ideonella margarita TaxID=2984191 RepID=A0ABU9CAM9_9BURK
MAIIPARGGSKRIPRKNVRMFAGRPMLAHAIALARDSGLFERVVVSTDDEEIAAVARAWGAEVPFVRPAALADDLAPTVPVVAHAVQALLDAGSTVRQVCCLYPAVPLLSVSALQEGLALLQRQPGATVYAFPVLAFESPIQRALRREADGRTAPLYPEHVQTRSQDLEPAFYDAGQFYWAETATWLGGWSVHGHASTFVLPAHSVVDIDVPEDWARAEALLALKLGLAWAPRRRMRPAGLGTPDSLPGVGRSAVDAWSRHRPGRAPV